MIENKNSSFIVKSFCVKTIFSQNNLVYIISANWCVLTKIQLDQNSAIIAYFDFYCYLSIVIVMTVISNFCS